MKWVGISGGWRKTNKEIEYKVGQTVRTIIKEGNGIVSGGALGVDYTALNEALKYDVRAERIKIFLPTTLQKYAKHLRKHANLGTITKEEAENLIAQLTKLKQTNPAALIEHLDEAFTEETKQAMYYARNSRMVSACDELFAFRIRSKTSEGLGTADTIKKAYAKEIPVRVFEYNLT